jgi:small membrane protein
MTAQFLLTLGLCAAWLYVLTQPGVSRFFKLMMYSVIAAGLYFVWFPGHATYLANRIGIGRGADLIFYTWIIFSLGVLINIHIKMRKNVVLLTELARHIALEKPYRIPDGSAAPTRYEDASKLN